MRLQAARGQAAVEDAVLRPRQQERQSAVRSDVLDIWVDALYEADPLPPPPVREKNMFGLKNFTRITPLVVALLRELQSPPPRPLQLSVGRYIRH